MQLHDPYSKFTKYNLNNGLEVHSQYWDRSWIKIQIVVHTGGREDSLHLPGLAHFVEHMVGENIPDLDIEKAKEFFENSGATYNFGSTNFRSTKYSFSIPNDTNVLKKSLQIFGSMLLEAKLNKKLERERDVIYREFQRAYTLPQKLEWDMQIRKSIFNGHWLANYNRPLGRPEGFLKITQKDLQNFYDQWYTPQNISMVVVGGIKPSELQNVLENSNFGIMKPGKRNAITLPLEKLPEPTGERNQIIKVSDYIKVDVNQTVYKAVWSFPADFPNKVTGIFTKMLRKTLNDEIREKRAWTYSLSAGYTDYEDIYEYEISVVVPPKSTHEINEVVRNCINTTPTNRDLFDRKIKSEILNLHMSDLSGGELAKNSAEELACYQRIIPIQENIFDLNEVSFIDIQKAAGILSTERQFTCLHIGQ